MKTALIFLAASGIFAGALIAGCGSDEATTSATAGPTSSSATGTGGATTSSSTTASGMGGSGGGGFPTPPTLGAQIDRFGRPAINTALDHTFDTDMTAKGAAKDAYNANTDPAAWAGAYSVEFEKNLAILDSLDTACGNQAFADKNDATPKRYGTLAGVLADDRLWMDTSKTTCSIYLGVEANATGLLPNMDCGGRVLDADVIDESYSLLAIGMPGGVTDGVDKNDVTNSATFPYLADPH